jgi:tetratricopeptide (TPR) repeat protein
VVEMLAGDYAAAERSLRSGYEALDEMGEKALLSTTAAFLAQAVFAQGKDDEARRFCELSEELGASGDVLTQTISRSVRARVLAKDGRFDEAEGLIREAIALIGKTDFLNHRGDALIDLAEILQEAARPEDARKAASQSLRLYEEKGNTVAAGKAEARLAELAHA